MSKMNMRYKYIGDDATHEKRKQYARVFTAWMEYIEFMKYQA